jgi:hypothetical protein
VVSDAIAPRLALVLWAQPQLRDDTVKLLRTKPRMEFLHDATRMARGNRRSVTMANKLLDAAQEVVRVRDLLIMDDVRVPMALSLAIDRLREAAEAGAAPTRTAVAQRFWGTPRRDA